MKAKKLYGNYNPFPYKNGQFVEWACIVQIIAKSMLFELLPTAYSISEANVRKTSFLIFYF